MYNIKVEQFKHSPIESDSSLKRSEKDESDSIQENVCAENNSSTKKLLMCMKIK